MFKMARFSFLFLVLLAAAALAASKAEKSSLSSGDEKFVKEAAQGGMMEVELGRLAADKAASDDVKQFGKRMVDDHSKANDELMTLANNLSSAEEAMQLMINGPESDGHSLVSAIDFFGDQVKEFNR